MKLLELQRPVLTAPLLAVFAADDAVAGISIWRCFELVVRVMILQIRRLDEERSYMSICEGLFHRYTYLTIGRGIVSNDCAVLVARE